MDKKYIESILKDVSDGSKSVDEAMEILKNLPYEDIGFANIDQHRNLRTGHGEVIYGRGKTPEQTAKIVERMCGNNSRILITRAGREHFEAVREVTTDAQYFDDAQLIIVGGMPREKIHDYKIAVVTAGTSDVPIAEEAALCIEFFGGTAHRIYDVGVAGLHRLLDRLETIRSADVVIVIAGMEGALASVVGGLVNSPVVAVPTSVGYGANFGGLSALLSMLNSCANGVGVVNIDNGYGAACLACKIAEVGEK